MRKATAFFFLLMFHSLLAAQVPQLAPPNPLPSDSHKADILLIVPHTDDDTLPMTYLAKATLDQGKRVAVVYCLSKGAGVLNQIGSEGGAAFYTLTQIDARRSLASFGIESVWFLNLGEGATSQNVLSSLTRMNHGATLEQVVRLIRLTRPEVVMTWFPGIVAGENHGDHQAAGVVTTEAFDMAGDPSVFPWQVAPAGGVELFEGLQPWQAKKLYFFTDTYDNADTLKGKGPAYSLKDVSPSRKVPYLFLALDGLMFHASSFGKGFLEQLERARKMDIDDAVKNVSWGLYNEPLLFILGKSHVRGTVTGDIFEGITPGAISFKPPRPVESQPRQGLSLELGGAWNYYRNFWQTHSLELLPQIDSSRLLIREGTNLSLPLLISNNTDAAREVTLTLTSKLNEGWTMKPRPMRFNVRANETYPLYVEFATPPRGVKEGVARNYVSGRR